MLRAAIAVGVVVLAGAAGVAAGRATKTREAPPPSGMAGMPGMAGGEHGPGVPAGASSKAVYISSARQQLVGVRTTAVARKHADGTIRTVGTLAYDETRVTHVHVKVAGWVEQLFVDYVGKNVKRGQPLFSVYSPDLVTAQSDYLIALRAREQLGATSMSDARNTSDALVRASRDRLRRWDVTDAEIAELEARGKASKTVTLFAPFDGVLLERSTYAGQYVTPETSTFKVGDLSQLWAVGQVFEYETGRLYVGQDVDVEFPYGQSAEPVRGRIDFIYPDIDPQTRRVRFRVSLPNKNGKLKPDTYITLVVHGQASDRLVVPREAVIDSGDRKYVLVALDGGYFDPRTVQVGAAADAFYPVLSGIAEGERVVTSAQFLVDSETNLMSAMQNMSMTMPGMGSGEMDDKNKPAPPASAAPAPPPTEHRHEGK